VLAANAGSLRELHLCSVYNMGRDARGLPTVKPVVAAAPLLQVLTVEHVVCGFGDALWMLRAEPPYAALQMHSLSVRCGGADDHFDLFVAALAYVTLQPALSHLYNSSAVNVSQPALMGALVDAVLARRLRKLMLDHCSPPAAAPLACLLAEGSLAALVIYSTPSEYDRTDATV
jgi:hypothetical protein